MHQYIVETGNTVRSFLELVNHEDSLVKEQTSKLREAIVEFKAQGWNFHTSDLNDDFSDSYVMAASGCLLQWQYRAIVINIRMQ